MLAEFIAPLYVRYLLTGFENDPAKGRRSARTLPASCFPGNIFFSRGRRLRGGAARAQAVACRAGGYPSDLQLWNYFWRRAAVDHELGPSSLGDRSSWAARLPDLSF